MSPLEVVEQRLKLSLAHPYELCLALNDTAHRKTRVRSSQTNGLVERFYGTALDEFFRTAFRTAFYGSVEALRRDFPEPGEAAPWTESRSTSDLSGKLLKRT